MGTCSPRFTFEVVEKQIDIGTEGGGGGGFAEFDGVAVCPGVTVSKRSCKSECEEGEDREKGDKVLHDGLVIGLGRLSLL